MIDYAKLFILGGIFLAGASFGWYFPHRALVEYKTSVEVAAKTQEEKVKSIRSQQELVNKGIEKEYEAKLNLLRQYYANGVRQPNTSKLPTLSNTTNGADAITAYNLLVGQCAEATQQLVSLQEWTKEQIGIK
jgi:hypothetical protein